MPRVRLLNRIFDAQATERLRDVLRDIKESQALGNQLKFSGNSDHVRREAEKALDNGWLTLARLATVVDEIEENGAQHIFLFDLTDVGVQQLTAAAFRNAYAAPPAVAHDVYAEVPQNRYLFTYEAPTRLVVKQIATAHFWEKDDGRSFERDEEKATYWIRRTRRAVNVLYVYPEARQAEIRLDRLTDDQDDRVAERQLAAFLAALAPTLNPATQLTNVPIWQGFHSIVLARNETKMTTDEAQDPRINQRVTSRREDAHAGDIRDHPDYRMGDARYTRNHLKIYWWTEHSQIHSHMSRFEAPGGPYGKVYIGAKKVPAEIDHVIARIRHFAP